MPTDPTIVSAFATIVQAGVVGAVLILIVAGVFRLSREVKREEQAVERERQATLRERELGAEQATRFDKAMAQIEKLADGQERLVAAVEKLALGGGR